MMRGKEPTAEPGAVDGGLKLPTFHYRLVYRVAWGSFVGSFIPFILALEVFGLHSDAAALRVIAAECVFIATCAAACLIARQWGRRSATYLAFQQAIEKWAAASYGLQLTPKQTLTLAAPAPEASARLFPRSMVPAAVTAQWGWPPYSRAEGWYVSYPTRLTGAETTAPALAGRRLPVMLVSKAGTFMLVQAGTGEQLPRGLALSEPFAKDPTFKPYSTRSIVGLFLLGAGVALVLNAIGLVVLFTLAPDFQYSIG